MILPLSEYILNSSFTSSGGSATLSLNLLLKQKHTLNDCLDIFLQLTLQSQKLGRPSCLNTGRLETIQMGFFLSFPFLLKRKKDKKRNRKFFGNDVQQSDRTWCLCKTSTETTPNQPTQNSPTVIIVTLYI